MRAQGVATIVSPGFGVAGFFDQQAALRMQNMSNPQISLGSQTTYGVQAGFGFSVFKFKKKKGGLRLGLGGKIFGGGRILFFLSRSLKC